MARIECPICRDDLRSSDSDDLSQRLRTHMASAHGMISVGRGSAERPSGGSTTGATSIYSEPGRGHVSSGRPSGQEPRYEGGREQAGGMGERMEEKGRDVGRTMGLSRREENVELNCPMCGQLIRGRDEDDLSDELRGHMKGSHDIKPKLSARMGMS